MPQSAIEMFSTFGVAILCIVLGIISLSIFFTFLVRSDSAEAKPDTLAIRGILKKDTWVSIHTSNETFKRVRFIGFTNTESFKTHIPYDLDGMVILEDPEQKRYLIRAKSIRLIEIAAEENSKNTSDNKQV